MAKTLYDKIWDAHLVASPPGETPVLYIDRHLLHDRQIDRNTRLKMDPDTHACR